MRSWANRQTLHSELNLDQTPHDEPTVAIVFHIPGGTGNQPWTTLEHAIVATVGDTLRIVNDDTVPHRLHTSGIPFHTLSPTSCPGSPLISFCRRPSIIAQASLCTITMRGRTLSSGSLCDCRSNKPMNIRRFGAGCERSLSLSNGVPVGAAIIALISCGSRTRLRTLSSNSRCYA